MWSMSVTQNFGLQDSHLTHKRYSNVIHIYKRYLTGWYNKLRATREYDLTSEPQTLEAELPWS